MLFFRLITAFVLWSVAALGVFAIVTITGFLALQSVGAAALMFTTLLLSLGMMIVFFAAMGGMVLVWDQPRARRIVRVFVILPMILSVLEGMSGPIVPPFIRRDLWTMLPDQTDIPDGIALLP